MPARITKITEAVATDASGKSVPAFRIEFMVGTHGPFVEVFPKANFSAAAALQQVQATAQHVANLTA
ncbi:MAG TPA: hypothetical protein VGR84_15435 [Candidatus Acidoferrales bacterium]|nr:hypothetical protein [Candidatus Acidoferrales bacterium]